MTTKKKDEPNYADETVREHIHAELDETYSRRDPEEDATVSGETKAGKDKDIDVEFHEGVAVFRIGKAEVRLDRDGCLRLSKVASRAAQAVQ